MPAGLFVSGILIGCCFGRLFGLFLQQYIIHSIIPSSYAVIGASAILAGYARHTFSLAVILLECTEQINLFLPVVFTILVSVIVGECYNRSIYIIGVRIKNIPFLIEEIPHRNHNVTAEFMMKCPVRTLTPVVTVEDVKNAMGIPFVHTFPIVDSDDKLLGVISRESLMVLVGNKIWLERDLNSKINIEEVAKYKKVSLNSDSLNFPPQQV